MAGNWYDADPVYNGNPAPPVAQPGASQTNSPWYNSDPVYQAPPDQPHPGMIRQVVDATGGYIGDAANAVADYTKRNATSVDYAKGAMTSMADPLLGFYQNMGHTFDTLASPVAHTNLGQYPDAAVRWAHDQGSPEFEQGRAAGSVARTVPETFIAQRYGIPVWAQGLMSGLAAPVDDPKDQEDFWIKKSEQAGIGGTVGGLAHGVRNFSIPSWLTNSAHGWPGWLAGLPGGEVVSRGVQQLGHLAAIPIGAATALAVPAAMALRSRAGPYLSNWAANMGGQGLPDALLQEGL